MASRSTSGTTLRGPLTTGNCSVSIIDTDISDITGILCYIATGLALGPNRSALLILILSGLLGISLLLVLVLLFILLKRRSKQSKAVEGMPTLKQLISTNDKQPCEQNVPNHSTEQYSLAQSVETEERNDETERVSDVSEHDYEDPPGDEYMNADEINTVTIGHQIYHLG